MKKLERTKWLVAIVAILAMMPVSSFGRFLSVDPQASKYPTLSPYTYCADNPMKFVDKEGECFWLAAGIAAALYYVLATPEIAQTPTNAEDIYQPTFGEKVLTQVAAILGATAIAWSAEAVGQGMLKFSAPSDATAVSVVEVADDIAVGPKGGTSWTTARRNYWKSEAANNPGRFTAENLERTRKGLADSRANRRTGQTEFKELHHKHPVHKGGTHERRNLMEVWPDEHDNIDEFRHVKRNMN
jgi:hypothetical protein